MPKLEKISCANLAVHKQLDTMGRNTANLVGILPATQQVLKKS